MRDTDLEVLRGDAGHHGAGHGGAAGDDGGGGAGEHGAGDVHARRVQVDAGPVVAVRPAGVGLVAGRDGDALRHVRRAEQARICVAGCMSMHIASGPQ